jgi:Arc/MetJ family transcription regulator
MRTNIEIDDTLVKEAFKYSEVRTKKDLIDLSLKEFIANRKRKDISELKGKIRFADGYDYKAMRKEAK